MSDPLPTGHEPFTDRLAVRLADFVVRWRWLVLLASLVVVGAATTGLSRLEFVNDYRIFFSDENPELIAFNRFQDTYTNNDNVIFVLKPRVGDVFSRDTLAAVEALTEAAWTIPYVIRVDSVTNFQHSRAEGNQLIVADLVRDAASLTDEELAERRDIALAEPILNGYLITPDASVTGVSVTLQFRQASLDEVPDAIAASRAIANEVRRANPGLEVAVTGGVAMNAAFSEATAADGSTLYPIMLAILMIMTAVILRSMAGTVATVVVVVFSTLTAVG
ncbi:MAG: MMPL family transporter, partial [Alphaproteobacteria bacterium]|nr:MMPL family transporter [Alphaproteobacteria bacterium]